MPPLGREKINTRVVQISNVSPSASREQLYHMFGYFGKIEEIKVYPSETSALFASAQSKVCYIKYDETEAVDGAQHMTNTVFIDRALMCVPVSEGKIPDEEMAMKTGGPALPGQRQLPPNIINQIQFVGSQQLMVTIDPSLAALGLPPYPPLPSNTDASKMEEIRRTIYVGNLPKDVQVDDLVAFFTENVGEVMYARLAGDENLPTRFAYVEFSSQHSVPTALQNTGIEYKGNKLRIQHSTVAVIKPLAKTLDMAKKEVEDALKNAEASNPSINKNMDVDEVLRRFTTEPTLASSAAISAVLKSSRSSSRRLSRSRSPRGRSEKRRSKSRSRHKSIRKSSSKRRSVSRRRSKSRSRDRRKSSSKRRSVSRRRSKSRSRDRRSKRKSRSKSKDRPFVRRQKRTPTPQRHSKSRSRRPRSKSKDRSRLERNRSREKKIDNKESERKVNREEKKDKGKSDRSAEEHAREMEKLKAKSKDHGEQKADHQKSSKHRKLGKSEKEELRDSRRHKHGERDTRRSRSRNPESEKNKKSDRKQREKEPERHTGRKESSKRDTSHRASKSDNKRRSEGESDEKKRRIRDDKSIDVETKKDDKQANDQTLDSSIGTSSQLYGPEMESNSVDDVTEATTSSLPQESHSLEDTLNDLFAAAENYAIKQDVTTTTPANDSATINLLFSETDRDGDTIMKEEGSKSASPDRKSIDKKPKRDRSRKRDKRKKKQRKRKKAQSGSDSSESSDFDSPSD